MVDQYKETDYSIECSSFITLSPPFKGGLAGPLVNYDTNADTGRGG